MKMNLLTKTCFVIATCFVFTCPVESARILVVAPFFGKSHSIYIHPIVLELANRNHDIVLISTNTIKDPPPNIKLLQSIQESKLTESSIEMYDTWSMSTIPHTHTIWNDLLNETENCLKSPDIKRFLTKNDDHFDLVISELFHQEALYMFAHKYKAPLILLGSSTYYSGIDSFMGNPSTLSYLNHEFTKYYGDLTLYQRIENYIIGNYISIVNKWYAIRQQDDLARKYFNNLNQPLPSIEELENNVSLVLLNTHFSFDTVRPLVPGIVEIGGVHIKPPKELPGDIKKFLDDAKNGAIFFGFGSYLKSSEMPEEKLKIFFNSFKSLKQRILWKWDGENEPKNFPNIFFSNWMPQSDILAHPNIRAFISHGGMLSMQEAVSRGVPILGISVYGDQFLNMEKIKSKGMAVHIPYNTLNEENFNKSLNAILNDVNYANSAKEVSRRYHDQQNTPMDNAMYWIEYVIRHKGAKFMKSKLVDYPWYKYHNIDIYFLFFISAAVLYFISPLVLRYVELLVFVILSRAIRIIRSFFVEGILIGTLDALKFIITIYAILYGIQFILRILF
ncbi:UDP-glycosyltransferase UGT5-like [Arctopsyche grandis]|uniref:UDP-glycosyltransferase UGT5-like n=1 Tax=Arctopsyche grandis TaxID=121162 RepID=UPI00406D6610